MNSLHRFGMTTAIAVLIVCTAKAQNVGIGISDPDYKLTIQSSDSTVLRLMGPGVYWSKARLSFGDEGRAYIEEDVDDKLTIYALGRLALMGGNVGIGTTNPEEKLHVQGVIRSTGEIQSHSALYGLVHMSGGVSMGTYINGPAAEFGTYTNHPLWLFTNNSPDPTIELNNITGNVGIGGITNAEEKLHVDGNIKTTGLVYCHSNSYGFEHSSGGVSLTTYIDATTAQIGTISDHPLYFFTNDSPDPSLMIQNVTGLIGIRKAVPETDLHIKQSALSSRRGIELELAENANDWRLLIDTDNDMSFYFNSVLKSWFSDVDGTFGTFSDRRLKKDIVMMEPTLSRVLALAPSTYHYIDAENADVPMSSGFMAQDVQELFPDLVSEKNGFLGLNYTGFIPIAIKAIQEQQQIIQTQEERIAKLEATVEELMKKM